ncbi:hypothetical protein O181_036612 [Austropuccinia psidii MF-1]|uniref:Uncharacterized protein n=1 Tax=Austropuccinia psidii MF-1 TaxID=1389203 RepID=A0A9Q3D7E7_9BASI|nr:hypothetical protein [Austropuccinia psidii MF-1]
MSPALEKKGPVASNSSKPAPEMSKDNPKGPQNKQRGPKDNQGKGKGKASWHRPYPQGYRLPKLQPSARDSVFIMARTLISWRFKMENAFESDIFNSEKDEPLTWFLKQKNSLSALHPDISDSIINMKKFRKCGGEL